MATIHPCVGAADRLGPRSRSARFHAAVTAAARWLRNWKERRLLVAMSDDLLRDIGLTRGDVEREFERPYWCAVDHAGLDAVRRRSGPRLGTGGGH